MQVGLWTPFFGRDDEPTLALIKLRLNLSSGRCQDVGHAMLNAQKCNCIVPMEKSPSGRRWHNNGTDYNLVYPPGRLPHEPYPMYLVLFTTTLILYVMLWID